eukprot:jgi/Psemu1/10138/gm1.10138_g
MIASKMQPPAPNHPARFTTSRNNNIFVACGDHHLPDPNRGGGAPDLQEPPPAKTAVLQLLLHVWLLTTANSQTFEQEAFPVDNNTSHAGGASSSDSSLLLHNSSSRRQSSPQQGKQEQQTALPSSKEDGSNDPTMDKVVEDTFQRKLLATQQPPE